MSHGVGDRNWVGSNGAADNDILLVSEGNNLGFAWVDDVAITC